MMLLEQLEIYSIIYYNYFRQSININVSKKDLLKLGNLTARTHTNSTTNIIQKDKNDECYCYYHLQIYQTVVNGIN